MRSLLVHVVWVGFVATAAASAASGADGASGASHRVLSRAWDEQGRVVWERGLVAHEDHLAYEKHARYVDDEARGKGKPDKPNKPGKPGDGGGDPGDPGNDCASTAHKFTGYRWSVPYAGYTTAFPEAFNAAGQTWDDGSSASLFAGFQVGLAGVAGQLDGVNQVDFVDLGAGGTIAVTTTWYNLYSGQAVESDAQYNTYYAWATDGSPGAMDVENIGAHELGHTYGLDHPSGPGHKISCLTMYAYAAPGELHKRSLGAGDLVGIRSLYGV